MAVYVRAIHGIVCHRTENIADFASYHRVIDRDGYTHLYHHDDEIAFHARHFNSTTLGVALVGDFALGEPGKNWYPTPAQLVAVERVCAAWLKAYPGIWLRSHTELGQAGTTFPEKLTPAHACPGSHWDIDDLRSRVGALRGEVGATDTHNS